MSWIGKIVNRFIENNVREVVTEIYAGHTRISGMIQPPGFDSSPIDGDQGVSIEIKRSNKSITVGVYPDAKAKAGEARVYARDADGNLLSEIYLDENGKVLIESSLGGAMEQSVLGESLRDQIQIIADQLAQLKDDFTNWMPLANDGGGALQAMVLANFCLTPDPDLSDVLSDGVENN